MQVCHWPLSENPLNLIRNAAVSSTFQVVQRAKSWYLRALGAPVSADAADVNERRYPSPNPQLPTTQQQSLKSTPQIPGKRMKRNLNVEFTPA